MKIAILYGGTSTEHKISIQTGLAIAEAISGSFELDMVDYNGDFGQVLNNLLESDLVFNALHGGSGENGDIQSYLDLHQIPYTGSGSRASKIAMDKNISKIIAQSVSIPTPNWLLIKIDRNIGIRLQDFDTSKFKLPYVVKPSDEGSTYGLSIVYDESELPEAIGCAFEFSNEILIEEYIPGRELTVGILGDRALPVIEIQPSHDLYDFDCKYVEGLSKYVVPAQLSDILIKNITADALKIYQTLDCRHYARVDFRINENNEHYFLEINTLPGMTSTSLLPKAAKAAGLEFSDLIKTIINLAKEG